MQTQQLDFDSVLLLGSVPRPQKPKSSKLTYKPKLPSPRIVSSLAQITESDERVIEDRYPIIIKFSNKIEGTKDLHQHNLNIPKHTKKDRVQRLITKGNNSIELDEIINIRGINETFTPIKHQQDNSPGKRSEYHPNSNKELSNNDFYLEDTRIVPNIDDIALGLTTIDPLVYLSEKSSKIQSNIATFYFDTLSPTQNLIKIDSIKSPAKLIESNQLPKESLNKFLIADSINQPKDESTNPISLYHNKNMISPTQNKAPIHTPKPSFSYSKPNKQKPGVLLKSNNDFSAGPSLIISNIQSKSLTKGFEKSEMDVEKFNEHIQTIQATNTIQNKSKILDNKLPEIIKIESTDEVFINKGEMLTLPIVNILDEPKDFNLEMIQSIDHVEILHSDENAITLQPESNSRDGSPLLNNSINPSENQETLLNPVDTLDQPITDSFPSKPEHCNVEINESISQTQSNLIPMKLNSITLESILAE